MLFIPFLEWMVKRETYPRRQEELTIKAAPDTKKHTTSSFSAPRNLHLWAPLLSALLLIGAFPPFEQGYLAWFALIPLLAACATGSSREAFFAGFLFGLPFHLYVNYYLGHVLFPYLTTLPAIATMAAMAVYISLFNGLFGLLFNLAYRLGDRLGHLWFSALAAPCLWLLTEYLRSLGFMAYNVGYIGYTQWQYPTVLNIASVYGYWGLSFLIVFFQSIILLAAGKPGKRLTGLNLYSVTGCFLIMTMAGLFLPLADQTDRTRDLLFTALIQGNSAPEEVIASGRGEIMDHYIDLTRQALANEPAVELVVWPETVVDLHLGTAKTHHVEMITLVEELGVDLLYGARVRTQEALYNSIVFLQPGAKEIPLYHKHRLVPFVEFFPFEELLNRLLQLDLLLGRYRSGEEIVLFRANETSLGGVVCFESYFGDHTRLFAAAGSRHLFVVTNDAWFKESIGLEQHAQVAAIRAAEMGTGVTQVANSGITISFDHRGRELFRSGKNEEAVLTLPLDLHVRNTIYRRYGDFLPAAAALFMVSATTALVVRKMRNRSRNERHR